MSPGRSIELSSGAIERHLGAPVPVVPLVPPPANALELGLLELEEEVLLDEYTLARDTFGTHLCAWRLSCDLGPLAALRRRYDEDGVAIERVRWDALAAMSDAEIDYACRVTKALGAHLVTIEPSRHVAARLEPHARRHGLAVHVDPHRPDALPMD